jgi:ABC-type nitrate/sulfonate/bicarbonate transport system ATPase subunit
MALTKQQSAISLEHVHLSMGHRAILKNISLEVHPGEFLCLVGESGSGKTTILKCIAGLYTPSLGEVYVGHKKLNGINQSAAMVFQNFALFPWLTVYENACFPYTITGKKIPEQLIRQSLADVGLAAYHERYPKDLSGGQRQRVGIARALAVQRPILLMDEPFSALDIKTATELRRDLAELCVKKQLTVVMVSHLVEEAVELADRVLIIREGEIASSISIGLAKPRNQTSSEFLTLARRITEIIER